MPIVWPVSDQAKITSNFGYREAPTAGASTQHKGIDISVKNDTPVKSAISGIISDIGYNDISGNYVSVYDEENGLVSTFRHLNSVYGSVGDAVSAGQTIALSGNTGNTTGPHLHFELSRNGVFIDPLTERGGEGDSALISSGLLDTIKQYWYVIIALLLLIGRKK